MLDKNICKKINILLNFMTGHGKVRTDDFMSVQQEQVPLPVSIIEIINQMQRSVIRNLGQKEDVKD